MITKKWNRRTRKAFVDYITEVDPLERNRLYNEHLREPLSDMVEEIIFMLTNKKSDDDLHVEVLSNTVISMVNFNPKAKVVCKPESYVETIIRGYVRDAQKRSYDHMKKTVSYNPF